MPEKEVNRLVERKEKGIRKYVVDQKTGNFDGGMNRIWVRTKGTQAE